MVYVKKIIVHLLGVLMEFAPRNAEKSIKISIELDIFNIIFFLNREYMYRPTRTCYPCDEQKCKKCVDYADKCIECTDKNKMLVNFMCKDSNDKSL